MPRSKLKRLITFFPSLLCRMTKRHHRHVTRHDLNFDSSDEDHGDTDCSPAQPRTEPQRHVTYNYTNDLDKVTHRTSYLPIPVSPKKRTRVSSPPSYDDQITPAELENEPEEDIDLDYLYHRIETLSIDPAPRKRTPGVSLRSSKISRGSPSWLGSSFVSLAC